MSHVTPTKRPCWGGPRPNPQGVGLGALAHHPPQGRGRSRKCQGGSPNLKQVRAKLPAGVTQSQARSREQNRVQLPRAPQKAPSLKPPPCLPSCSARHPPHMQGPPARTPSIPLPGEPPHATAPSARPQPRVKGVGGGHSSAHHSPASEDSEETESREESEATDSWDRLDHWLWKDSPATLLFGVSQWLQAGRKGGKRGGSPTGTWYPGVPLAPSRGRGGRGGGGRRGPKTP